MRNSSPNSSKRDMKKGGISDESRLSPRDLATIAAERSCLLLKTPRVERPPSGRRRKVDLARRVNAPLALDFTADQLTSYAGLEVDGAFGSERPVPAPCPDHGALPAVRRELRALRAGPRRALRAPAR